MDPSGNVISIVEQQRQRGDTFQGIQIYNGGFYLPDVEVARAFYVDLLGFTSMTEQYYPNIPLLQADQSFGFMLHGRKVEDMNEDKPMQKAQAHYPDDAQLLLMFATSDLDRAIEHLKQKGITFLYKKPQRAVDGRAYTAFKDPFGLVSELYEHHTKSSKK